MDMTPSMMINAAVALQSVNSEATLKLRFTGVHAVGGFAGAGVFAVVANDSNKATGVVIADETVAAFAWDYVEAEERFEIRRKQAVSDSIRKSIAI
jgi:hypothetical protein